MLEVRVWERIWTATLTTTGQVGPSMEATITVPFGMLHIYHYNSINISWNLVKKSIPRPGATKYKLYYRRHNGLSSICPRRGTHGRVAEHLTSDHWVSGWVNQAYSRLSTTHGHITDCKLDSVVYVGVCVWVNVDLCCLGRTIYARQFLGAKPPIQFCHRSAEMNHSDHIQTTGSRVRNPMCSSLGHFQPSSHCTARRSKDPGC